MLKSQHGLAKLWLANKEMACSQGYLMYVAEMVNSQEDGAVS